jgi:hypothetical protein
LVFMAQTSIDARLEMDRFVDCAAEHDW